MKHFLNANKVPVNLVPPTKDSLHQSYLLLEANESLQKSLDFLDMLSSLFGPFTIRSRVEEEGSMYRCSPELNKSIGLGMLLLQYLVSHPHFLSRQITLDPSSEIPPCSNARGKPFIPAGISHCSPALYQIGFRAFLYGCSCNIALMR